jgi:hypothetical protein
LYSRYSVAAEKRALQLSLGSQDFGALVRQPLDGFAGLLRRRLTRSDIAAYHHRQIVVAGRITDHGAFSPLSFSH